MSQFVGHNLPIVVGKHMNIIFDLDGTLIDSAPDLQSMASAILRKRGKQDLTLDETRHFIGEGAAVFVRRMMVARDIDVTAEAHALLLEQFLAQYEISVDKAVFYPNVLSALAVFKAAGYKLGLCTNKPERATRAVIRHMGIEGMFDAVMAGGVIDSRKPEPDMLLEVIERLEGGASVFIGDSEVDAETAQRAETLFALFTRGYRKQSVQEICPDWQFEDFGALPGIVEEARLALTNTL